MLVGLVGPCDKANLLVIKLLAKHFEYQILVVADHDSTSPESLALRLNSVSIFEIRVAAFPSLEEALGFATTNYQSNYVFLHSTEKLELEFKTFSTRPFYCPLGVCISANLFASNLAAVCCQQDTTSTDISIDTLSDQLKKYYHSGLDQYYKHCITLDSLKESSHLVDSIKTMLQTLKTSIRPTWDQYFMEIAKLTSNRSNCMKRRVGAILVSRQSHHIISTGYNGTPAGLPNCFEGGCKRCNENTRNGSSLSTCLCLHAEENAIFEAGRDRIALYTNESLGVVLYTTSCPCIYCAKKIIQAGISEVVYFESYHMDNLVKTVLEDAKIKLRVFKTD